MEIDEELNKSPNEAEAKLASVDSPNTKESIKKPSMVAISLSDLTSMTTNEDDNDISIVPHSLPKSCSKINGDMTIHPSVPKSNDIATDEISTETSHKISDSIYDSPVLPHGSTNSTGPVKPLEEDISSEVKLDGVSSSSSDESLDKEIRRTAEESILLDIPSLSNLQELTISCKPARRESSDVSSGKRSSPIELKSLKITPKSDIRLHISKSKPFSNSGIDKKTIDANKPTADKSSKSSKRKREGSPDSIEIIEKFPIQYKGFKKRLPGVPPKTIKKNSVKWNPFNPAFRRESRCLTTRQVVCDEFDPSSLQPEYAQYLGLQPIVKFKCSYCGMSSFQSMNALNSHKADCCNRKVSRSSTAAVVPPSPVNEPKSANIKLTRKVFLCSACGTYYENWNLFLHMREAHRRYICLSCLGMFSVPEKLAEHLRQKHGLVNKELDSPDQITKNFHQAYYLLCLNCDKVFSEEDKIVGHKCSVKSAETPVPPKSDTPILSPQEPSVELVQDKPVSSINISKPSTSKKLREPSKKQNQKSSVPKEILKKDTESLSTSVCLFEKELAECNTSISPLTNPVIAELPPNEPFIPQPISLPAPPDPELTITPIVSPAVTCPPVDNIEPSLGEAVPIIPQPSPEPVVEPALPLLPEPPQTVKPLRLRKPSRNSSRRRKPATKKQIPHLPISVPSPVPLSPTTPLSSTSPLSSTTPLLSLPSTTPVLPLPSTSPFLPLPSVTPPSQTSPPDLLPTPTDNDLVSPLEPHMPEANEQNGFSDVKEESKEIPIENSLTEPIPPPELPVPTPPSPPMNQDYSLNKISISKSILKLKLQQDMDSEADSDDSQKLSLVVDESANNSGCESKTADSRDENNPMSCGDYGKQPDSVDDEKEATNSSPTPNDPQPGDIPLAGEDVAAMALTLDDKIENVPIQAVLKECVRTSCLSCNYCRHAVKIAVNGKFLALHLLSEHRYMPVKNETSEDVVNKLKASLDVLETMFFNTETYDSSDASIHVPFDQDTSFDCLQCSYVCSTHKDLYAHKKKSHTKSLQLCIMCKSNFYSYSELICHLCPGHYDAEVKFHNVDINFRCCFCRFDSIPSAFRLMVHLRKSHHTCDICLEICVDQQKLSTHLWKHKMNHLCYRCGIAYASKPDITKHLFWKHGHESVLCKKCLQKKWPHVFHFCIPPTSFLCEECNASFSKAVALKVHKRIHGNDYPYACTQCEKKFVSKKLLQRHEDRHNNIDNIQNNGVSSSATDDDQKEEVINVTDINDPKEEAAEAAESKETEIKDKAHKKHKKDKKDKRVVDVYDLPPLNLSSASDSSDEEDVKSKCQAPVNFVSSTTEEHKDRIDLPTENDDGLKMASTVLDVPNVDKELCDVVSGLIASPHDSIDSSVTQVLEGLVKSDTQLSQTLGGATGLSLMDDGTSSDVGNNENNLKSAGADMPNIGAETVTAGHVEGIWENFYKTNPHNVNLPYPLCAMKSEVAYGIIMGDHDYCTQYKAAEPVIKEDIPSTSHFDSNLMDDNLNDVNELVEKALKDESELKDEFLNNQLNDSDKKKPRTPKKKKSSNDNDNSSSSSDSSSESDSSSCSCGTNCSCSSCSSNSSSSSSSDSESSGTESKQERRKKKRERRSKTKSETEVTSKEGEDEEQEPEIEPEPIAEKPVESEVVSRQPIDPPIQESELETDETSTDEEFYDRQPQRIANQLLAEKRNQLMLLASVAPINNGNVSPNLPVEPVVCPPQPVIPTPKPKARTKKKRKVVSRPRTSGTKAAQSPRLSFNPQYTMNNTPSPTNLLAAYNSPIAPEHPKPNPMLSTPTVPLTPSMGRSEGTDKSRSSKRRRIPNKFYGYSSDEEYDKQTPKWKKQESIPLQLHKPPVQILQPTPPPLVPPPTPRIQLTVPKHVIRKPSYTKSHKTKVPPLPTPQPPPPPPPAPVLPPLLPPVKPVPEIHRPLMEPSRPLVSNQFIPQSSSHDLAPPNRTEKDVYCYCRCPYDEVSEMIACDDENCPIEWFHFECVGIQVPPRGQWYCPGCCRSRGLPPN